MKISIITINYNNDNGLQKTLNSVAAQINIKTENLEHIIIDGYSTDSSNEIIKTYAKSSCYTIKWISEPDKGIYNAMNKGIKMASGDYLEFLNSGDCLASNTVTSEMLTVLEEKGYPSILYGNMLKAFQDGHILKDLCFGGREISLLGFYTGTLNHSPAYIKKELFDKYGMYDEALKIVSDWKWYFKAIILGEEVPIYTDIDVTLFDMYGISETNKSLDKEERRKEIEKLIPHTILKDYDDYHIAIDQMKRIKRHPVAYKLVWFIERCLFKIEKRKNRKKSISEFI